LDADYVRTLFDYGYWARDRLLKAAAGMSEAEYASDNGFTYKSIRGILTHALAAEAAWSMRLRGEQVTGLPAQEELTSVEALAARWRQVEVKMRGVLAELSDADLERMTTMRAGELPLWQILAHLANHSMQHRSEAAEALTMAGRSPGDLDMLFYFIEKRSS